MLTAAIRPKAHVNKHENFRVNPVEKNSLGWKDAVYYDAGSKTDKRKATMRNFFSCPDPVFIYNKRAELINITRSVRLICVSV